MKVYVLTTHYPEDPGLIVGVFSTPEAAMDRHGHHSPWEKREGIDEWSTGYAHVEAFEVDA